MFGAVHYYQLEMHMLFYENIFELMQMAILINFFAHD